MIGWLYNMLRAGCFVTPLVDIPLPDGSHWEIYKDLVWQWWDGKRETIKRGFVTDYASVPDLSFFAGIAAAAGHHWGINWLFWSAIVICVLAKWIDDDHRTDAPAAFHDRDYTAQDKPRIVADLHLFLRMIANRRRSPKQIKDIGHLAAILIKSTLYFFNLRLFGWTHWHGNKK